MDLMQKNRYQDVDVATADLIATKHNRTVGDLNKLFNRNRHFFKEGKDVFIIPKSQKSSDDFKNLFHSNAQKEAYLFTRTGWLLLTKPMEDKDSWDLWASIIDRFFEYEDRFNQLKEQYDSLKANILRRDAAIKFLPMKEAIENNESLSEQQRQWGAQNYSILICKGLTGFTPKVYKKKYKTHGLEWRDHIKKTFPELLEAVTATETFIAQLQDTGVTYREAKPTIEKYMMKQIERVREKVKKIESV